MRNLILVLSIHLAACYTPDLTGRFACTKDTQDKDCPSGLMCDEGCCKDPGNLMQKCQLSPVPPVNDPKACKSDGTEIVAGSVWACNGAFANGDMASVCGTSTHPCTASDMNLKQVAGKCPASGFYATKIVASGRWEGDENQVKSINCGMVSTMMGRAPILIGCGGPAVNGDSACGGLSTYLRCDMPPQGWSCSNSATNASLAMAPGGVLCCKNP